MKEREKEKKALEPWAAVVPSPWEISLSRSKPSLCRPLPPSLPRYPASEDEGAMVVSNRFIVSSKGND